MKAFDEKACVGMPFFIVTNAKNPRSALEIIFHARM